MKPQSDRAGYDPKVPKSLLVAWFPVAIWMLFILRGSGQDYAASNTEGFLAPLLRSIDPHLSAHAIESFAFVIRKTAHVLEYAVLGLLLFRALAGSKRAAGSTARLALCLAIAFAALDEVRQALTPNREPSAADVALDAGGAGLALFVLCRARRNRLTG